MGPERGYRWLRRAIFNQRARKRQGTGRGLRRCLLCWGPIGSVTALTSPSWVAVDTAFVAFSTRAAPATRSVTIAFATRHYSAILLLLLKKLAADPQCQQLLLNAWYLDDGALAGPGSAVLRALEVLGAEGKPNGLILNPSKCELFSPNTDTFQPFDSSIPTSTTPNF